MCTCVQNIHEFHCANVVSGSGCSLIDYVLELLLRQTREVGCGVDHNHAASVVCNTVEGAFNKTRSQSTCRKLEEQY